MSRKWLTIGFVATALSVSVLIEHSFGLGYVTILSKTLDYYERFFEVLAERTGANALARNIISYAAQWLSLDLHLYPHWKHFLVPMWAYFASDRRALWQANKKAQSIFAITVGGVIAFASSLGVGTVPLTSPGRLAPIFLLLFGFLVYDLACLIFKATVYGYRTQTWWQTFSFLVNKYALTTALAGGIVIGAYWLLAQAGYAVSSVGTFIALAALLGMRDLGASLWSVARTGDDLSEMAAWSRGLGLLASLSVGATYFLSNILLGLLGL